jgi:hypothetical protein
MTNLVPSEIILATARGDVATVRSWLESGGDANQDLPDNYRWIIDQGDRFEDSDEEENIGRQRLLAVATEHNHCDLIRVLIAHGAALDHEFYYYGGEATALCMAVDERLKDAARLLIESGADVTRQYDSIMQSALLHPPLLRAMLISEVDTSAPMEDPYHGDDITPEAYARSRRDHYASNPHTYETDFVGIYGECVAMLEGSRLAGSYKNYVLQEYKELLRLRSLLARKRASFGPATPEAVARLFGGRADPAAASRRATRRRRPPPKRSAGVPDPAFWLVMEYWRLGDWRHP